MADPEGGADPVLVWGLRGVALAACVGAGLWVLKENSVYQPDWPDGDDRAEYIEIATAARNGAYFPIGLDICVKFNANRRSDANISENADISDLRCVVVNSNGSIDNLAYLGEGLVDFAIVQADVFVDAQLRGQPEGAQDGSPFIALSNSPQMCRGDTAEDPVSLVSEGLFILRRAEDETPENLVERIRASEDIGAGPEGSGTRYTVRALFRALGEDPDEYFLTEGTPAGVVEDLCNNVIDIGFRVVDSASTPPSRVIFGQNEACDLELMSLDPATIDTLLAANRGYRTVELALENAEGETATSIGMRSYLVTRGEYCAPTPTSEAHVGPMVLDKLLDAMQVETGQSNSSPTDPW